MTGAAGTRAGIAVTAHGLAAATESVAPDPAVTHDLGSDPGRDLVTGRLAPRGAGPPQGAGTPSIGTETGSPKAERTGVKNGTKNRQKSRPIITRMMMMLGRTRIMTEKAETSWLGSPRMVRHFQS